MEKISEVSLKRGVGVSQVEREREQDPGKVFWVEGTAHRKPGSEHKTTMLPVNRRAGQLEYKCKYF